MTNIIQRMVDKAMSTESLEEATSAFRIAWNRNQKTKEYKTTKVENTEKGSDYYQQLAKNYYNAALAIQNENERNKESIKKLKLDVARLQKSRHVVVKKISPLSIFFFVFSFLCLFGNLSFLILF